jgi:hypothetical protein
VSTTLTIARRLLACVASMTGERSTGSLTVKATGADTVLRKGAIGAPIVGGRVDYSRLFWVTADTVVTSAGVEVGVSSLLGGAHHNIAGPVQLRWFPQLDGVEPVSPFFSAPSGATTGDIKQVAIYEQLSADVARDLFLAKVGAFPALVLAWERSDRAVRKGEGSARQVERWTFYVVVSRADATERRGAEGLALLDDLETLLVDRKQIDGLPVSGTGIEITARGRRAIGPTSYVYTLAFGTARGVRRDDSVLAAQASPWLVSDVEVQEDGLELAHPLVDMTPDDPPPPDP